MFFYPQKEFVKDIQEVFNVETTGVAGPETLLETITLSEVLNRKHPAIYIVQRRIGKSVIQIVVILIHRSTSTFLTRLHRSRKDQWCCRW